MRRDIEVLSFPELEALWLESAMEAKIASRVLNTVIVATSPATNPLYSDGTSRIVVVLTQRGQHIGTFHEIEVPGRGVMHRHPKDYTRRDCSRVRLSSEPRPLG